MDEKSGLLRGQESRPGITYGGIGKNSLPGDYPVPYPDGSPASGPSLAQEIPSAPSLKIMDSVPGYETTSFNPACAPPPSYDESMLTTPPTRQNVTNFASISEMQAREALEEFVAQHCCYGSKAAKEMEFHSLESSSAFHYTLETFSEHRSTCWASDPYKPGTLIDGPHNGVAPGPWDVAVTSNSPFKNSTAFLEVPHTASVKPCHVCAGIGRTRCKSCSGSGQKICSICLGSGHSLIQHHHDHHHHHRHNHHHHHHHEPCLHCSGTGHVRCFTCSGHGQVTCTLCEGHCQLKCYIKLTVVWTNHFEDHIVERTSLPSELIRDVSGQIAFQEEAPRVWPVNHFPDNAINTASSHLVQKHAGAFPSERILLQRHLVRIIPVTQVYYSWKNDNSSYFVYGSENKVYFPNYPQSCCWGCVIL